MNSIAKIVDGKKTWLGLIALLVGFLGLTDVIPTEQLSPVFDSVIVIAGFIVSAVGNYHAHKKIK